jgi:hypothetical protein
MISSIRGGSTDCSLKVDWPLAVPYLRSGNKQQKLERPGEFRIERY